MKDFHRRMQSVTLGEEMCTSMPPKDTQHIRTHRQPLFTQ